VNRHVRREGLSLVFLFLGIYLSISLVSFNQFDPSLSSWSTTGEGPRNWGGGVGAFLADLLFTAFGIGAAALPFLFLGVAWWTFRAEESGEGGRWWRALGGIAALSSLLGILSFFVGHVRILEQRIFLPGQVGYLLGKRFLGPALSTAGGVAALTALLLWSLMLLTGVPLSALLGRFSRKGSEEAEAVRTRVKERLAASAEAEADAPPPAPRREEAPSPRVVAPSKVPAAPPRPVPDGRSFVAPSLDLLDLPPDDPGGMDEESLHAHAAELLAKLRQHGVDGVVSEIRTGPLVTTYEFKPAAGVKASRVVSLAGDLALAMRCEAVRVVPNIPGKGAMGLEIPNPRRSTIRLRELLASKAYAAADTHLPIAMGKDLFGEPVVRDLSRMPHLLIAGATGTGKSVFLHSLILSILYRSDPKEVRLLFVDPKMLELTPYEGIPHLLYPVVTQAGEAVRILKWAVAEMLGRYRRMQEKGVRNIEAYNREVSRRSRSTKPPKEGEEEEGPLPFIVIVIDELADLMMGTSSRREVEDAIARLAQMARAAGIHLIVATQRPSVDVITGLIKANLPARVSLKVASQIDSRTILDHSGAETLLGNGDMLFLQPGVGGIIRVHGAYTTEEEVRKVVEHLKGQGTPRFEESIASQPDEEEADPSMDEKYDEAVDLVLRAGQASTSMVQRRLLIGYNRASRIIEEMERQGIVGPSQGGKPREVFGRRDGG
jgi:S-DNA-T family DNA segregation ATPase FtsK/SpoIIIE